MEGFARPAPVAGPAVPISDPTIEYAAEVKPGKPDMGLLPQTVEETAIETAQAATTQTATTQTATTQTIGETADDVIVSFQNGDITAEQAVAKLMSQFGMSEHDATNTVFSASEAGQGLNEWVEEAWSPMADALQGVGSSDPSPGPQGVVVGNGTITSPEIESAPTYESTLRSLQIIPKETNIPMFALGAFTLYVVGKNLMSVARS